MGLNIMERSIIKALQGACGNRNIKFQVIVQEDQLHIYANHRKDYQPNYAILEANVRAAIISLPFDRFNSLWLYGRPLDRLEPNWQVFVELPAQIQDEIADTVGNIDNLAQLVSEINIEDIGNFDLETSATIGDAKLLFAQELQPKENLEINQKTLLPKEDDFVDLASFSEVAGLNSVLNSVDDSGLLQEQGLIHGKPLQEVEINTFVYSFGNSSKSTETADFFFGNNLVQYCFISNHVLLTEKADPPSKTVMRLVKFFHYLPHSDQQQLVFIMKNFLQGEEVNQTAEIFATSQTWLTKISALDEEEKNAFALWLSRYCFDPTATLAEFQAISAQNAAKRNLKTPNRSTEDNTEYNLLHREQDYSSPSTIDQINLDQPKLSRSPLGSQLLIPGIWTLVTILLIMIGVINHSSKAVNISTQIPAFCSQISGSSEYCRLAVDLAGAKAIAQAPKNLFPLAEETETAATYGCQRYANLKAGIPLNKIDPETTPVIFSHGEKIFPHIYVVEAQQKYTKQPGKIRVGCVYTSGQGQRSPKKIAADVIPKNWPSEPYQPQKAGGNYLALGILTHPINLGLSTIFAALAMAIASRLNLGLKIAHPRTIYLVALILSLVQLANTLLMPANLFGFLGAMVCPISTILIASLFIKDFRLNWKNGYPTLALNVLVIIGIQFLLYSLSLSIISSFI